MRALCLTATGQLLVGGLLLCVSPAFAEGALMVYGDPPRAPRPDGVLPRSGRVALASPPTAGFTINPSSREEARVAFNTLYAASDAAAPLWNGSIMQCVAGSTAPVFKDLTLLRINYFRAMAGIPATVMLDDQFSAKSQQAALIMVANGRPNHYPPADWLCYTPDGAEAASHSNLAVGESGPAAITGYIHDYGAGNYAAGHRRWVLYPQTRVMGTGDIPTSGTSPGGNANWIIDSHYFDPRPPVRDQFVAWPPPGFVPYPLVFPRWSFSFPEADLTNAVVSMSSGGFPLAVTVEKIEGGFAENTLVWYPSHLDPTRPYRWPRPVADTKYAVTVANVRHNGQTKTHSYEVTVFDPQVRGPDTQAPALAGPNPAALNQPNLYVISPVPRATGYQWLRGRPAPLSVVENAEAGLGGFTATITPGYDVIVALPHYSGKFYRLAHPAAADQILTYQRLLLPGNNAQVSFRSRLTLATSSQQAKVQVSADHGLNWQDIYSQAGTNDVEGYGEIGFTDRKVPLAAFAGRPILLRFNYHVDVAGARYPTTDLGIGWHFDNVALSNTEEVANPALGSVGPDAEFSFTPTQLGDHVLSARAQYFGSFFMDWAAATRVSAQNLPVPRLEVVEAPTVHGDRVSLEFRVANYRSSLRFDLVRASSLAGPWQPDAQAELEVVSPNTRFRISTPVTARGSAFLRVRAR